MVVVVVGGGVRGGVCGAGDVGCHGVAGIFFGFVVAVVVSGGGVGW